VRDPDRSRALNDEASRFVYQPWTDPQKAIPLLEDAVRADDRNTRAYRSLAILYLTEIKDLSKAEYYARQGLAVTDPPEIIVGKQKGTEPLSEAIRDGLYSVLFDVAVKRGDLVEAGTILQPLKAHWDKYHAGTYQSRHAELADALASQSKAGTAGCLVLLATVCTALLSAKFVL
jgi:hypothetical protein